MIVWNKVLKFVCSRYDSMYLTMCNPAVVCDATLAISEQKKIKKALVWTESASHKRAIVK